MTAGVRKMIGEVPEPMRPLLPEVLAALKLSLAEAVEWLTAGDALAAAKAVHDLSGASMTFSLGGLAVRAAEAEALLLAGDAEGARSSLDAFSTLLGELEAGLREK